MGWKDRIPDRLGKNKELASNSNIRTHQQVFLARGKGKVVLMEDVTDTTCGKGVLEGHDSRMVLFWSSCSKNLGVSIGGGIPSQI